MDIKCEFGRRVWNQNLFDNVSLYTSYITSFGEMHPVSKIKSITGYEDHQEGRKNSHVQGLFIEEFAIANLSRNIHQIFPGLTHLNISFCKLTKISCGDFKGLEKLTTLSVTNNLLKTLPDNLLINTPNLQVIRFNQNRIEFFNSKLLRPVLKNEILEVNFSENTKIDAYYNPISAKRASSSAVRKSEAADSVEELMEIIDEMCTDPSKVRAKSSRRNYSELFSAGIKSDFTILVESEEIPVHKTVLAINSPVFLTMFESDLMEKTSNQTLITDFSAEAVKEFVECLYSQKAPEATHAMEIFALAAKYDVSSLRSKCEEIIMTNLDEENAFEILNLAHLHNAEVMKSEAFEEIKNNSRISKIRSELINEPAQLKVILDKLSAIRLPSY